MSERPKLTLTKPLSLAKETQIHQMVKDIKKVSAQEKQKLSSKEQKKMDHQAKVKKAEEIKAALQWLKETYPECFNQKDPKPLKLKIEEDIFAALPADQSITKVKVRQALNHYTRRITYMKALLDSTHRYDLQGHKVQEIYPDHKAWMQEKLETIMKKVQAKKEASSLNVPNKPLQE